MPIKNPKFIVHKVTEDDPDEVEICGWQVQFTLPVDNPVDNVRKRRVKGGYIFDVPINTPGIHFLNLTQLLIMAEEAANIHTVHRA